MAFWATADPFVACPATLGAFVRLFAAVDSRVGSQVVFGDEPLVAFAALELFITAAQILFRVNT